MSATRAGASAVAAVLAGTVLVLVLVTWAASIGPDEVLRSPGISAGSSYEPSPTTSDVDVGGGDLLAREQQKHAHDGPPPAWVTVLGLLAELAVAAGGLWLLWRALRSLLARWRDRERPAERSRESVEFDVLDPGPALARELDADAGWQRAALQAGSPRNAIVACWDRFETAAERAGVRRRVWQTPSEFVLEVLERAGADPRAVSRLAALYREARFSDHPLTEDDRRRALDALDATHRSLALPAVR